MKILTALVLFLLSISLEAADRPNILWLTSEDNSPYLGCYGDELAMTPNIDALATQGVRYDLAFSNAPVCSVARTTLLLGMYPTALGLQNHRSRYPVPKGLRGYPELFREAGYYCTNNSKTDYNVVFGNKRTLWDESSGKAHYKNRKEGQSFFAVFNFTDSHEGQTFPEVAERNRRSGKLPKTSRLSLDQVKLPPYHPDLPEIRREWADFYDCMTTMDKRIGKALKELEESGLADDTIVFYYGDHGGSLARGKRSILDSGTRVPLIIRFGKNWKHLAPSGPGTATDRMVSFVDFAPTALSLAGIKVPEFMHGEAFLGAQAKAPQDHVFLYRGRMDERYDTIRAIRTKDRLYVKNYMPHLPNGQHYSYAYSSRITPAWEKCYEDGGCDEVQSIYWLPKSPEEFYRTKDDPHQVRNLIGEAGEQEAIGKLRAVLEGEMRKYHDSGLIPEAMYPVVAGGKSVGEYVAGGEVDFDGLKRL
ncbi:MAG: sulfatase, partial [Verrucomicrobia bacterium]|nr:sulfatase [Verrucomicrobiota bacterium]